MNTDDDLDAIAKRHIVQELGVDFAFIGNGPRRDSRAENNAPDQLGVWWG